MNIEKRDIKALRKFEAAEAGAIVLRMVAIGVVAALTWKEGTPGMIVGLILAACVMGCRPRLPGRLARLAEAEALEDDPRYHLDHERTRHWRD